MDLRCSHRLHGVVDEDNGTIEVSCRSSFCGAERGVLVLHRFNIQTGELLSTQLLRNPGKE